jgi:hypothetical protein
MSKKRSSDSCCAREIRITTSIVKEKGEIPVLIVNNLVNPTPYERIEFFTKLDIL